MLLYFSEKEPSFMDTLMKVKLTGSEIFRANISKAKAPSGRNQHVSVTSQLHYTPVDLEDSEIPPSSGEQMIQAWL